MKLSDPTIRERPGNSPRPSPVKMSCPTVDSRLEPEWVREYSLATPGTRRSLPGQLRTINASNWLRQSGHSVSITFAHRCHFALRIDNQDRCWSATVVRRDAFDRRSFARRRPITAPQSCAEMNPATCIGAMPANVLLRDRAIVIAGLAKDVEAVNQ